MAWWWTIVAGLPTLGIVAAALNGGAMGGAAYSAFKGVWATFVAIPVFIFTFVAAADARLHRGLAFARLTDESAVDAPPMVGRVARV